MTQVMYDVPSDRTIAKVDITAGLRHGRPASPRSSGTRNGRPAPQAGRCGLAGPERWPGPPGQRRLTQTQQPK